MFALPNIEIREAIGVEGFALVSLHDERLRGLANQHAEFKSYLGRFTTEFGNAIHPSILLCRSDAPKRYRSVEAIAAFRDAVAMAFIPRGWAHALRFENNRGVRYSDYFNVYPWMVDAQYEGIVAQTLDMRGWHVVEALSPQATPGLTPRSFDAGDLDVPLIAALLARWKTCFAADVPDTKDVQLFRSLNMANAAARMPAGADVTSYDIGRSVALWASAFEILAPSDSEAFKKVYALLERNTWNYTPCNEQKYRVYGRDQTLRGLPVWLFGAINAARNDYLHGNPLTPDRLVVAPGKRPLSLYAAPLYRMALAAFIDLKHEQAAPKPDDLSAYMAFRQDQFAFGRYQGDIEIALGTILHTEQEYRQLRQQRVDEARRRSRHIALPSDIE